MKKTKKVYMKTNRNNSKKNAAKAVEREIVQYIWVFVGLSLMILAGSLKAWGTLLFWQIKYGRPLVGLTAVGYLVTAVVFIRLNMSISCPKENIINDIASVIFYDSA